MDKIFLVSRFAAGAGFGLTTSAAVALVLAASLPPVSVVPAPQASGGVSDGAVLAERPIDESAARVTTLAAPIEMPREEPTRTAQTSGQDLATIAPVSLSLDGPAHRLFAPDHAAPLGAPVLAVIAYIPEDGPVDPGAFGLLPMPLTIAISPDRSDSKILATAARDAGHEVLADLSSTQLATAARSGTPEQLSQLALSKLASVPGASGLSIAGPTPLRPSATEAVMAPARDHGFALVERPQSARQPLASDLTPSSIADQSLPAHVSAPDVYQALENAAFTAKRSGSAIVFVPFGAAASDALVSWGMQRDQRPVWYAPVSSVLDRRTAS